MGEHATENVCPLSDDPMRSADPQAVSLWEGTFARAELATSAWTDLLRARGVKYAHPDDGWVKRNPDGTGTARVSGYPQFNAHPEVGDLIALGCPPRRTMIDGDWYRANRDHPASARHQLDEPEVATNGYRICRVTRVVERKWGVLGIWSESFEFEDTGERMPTRRPTHRPCEEADRA